MNHSPPAPLVVAYLAMREDLKRYFSLRLGSAAAAEDLVQEIYLKVISVPPDREIQNTPAFLYRLGSNLMLDQIRAAKRGRSRDSDWHGLNSTMSGRDSVSEQPAVDDSLAAKQRLEHLRAALGELPERTRAAFAFHKFDGMSHAETAKRLGISISAVEKHISAAVKHILRRVPDDR